VYAMPAFLIKQMDVTRQWTRSLALAEGKSTITPPPKLEIPMIFDETVLKGYFAAMSADGITLESLKTRDQGGWKYVDFNLKFTRLDGLMRQPCFKDCGVAFKAIGNDTCKLTVTPPPSGDVSGDATSSSDGMAKLTPFVNGLRVVVRIDLPGEIRNSTALMSDSRRATWEWDFDKDARAIGRLGRESLVVVFDGSQSRIREFEKAAGSTLPIIK